MSQNPTPPHNPTDHPTGPAGPPPGWYPPARPRLMRVSSDKALGGVCSGVARHLGIDVTLVRVLTAVAIVFSFPVGLIAYLVAWAVMPEDNVR